MSVALALVGMALIAGGVFWRWKLSGFRWSKRTERRLRRGASAPGERPSPDGRLTLFPTGEADSSLIKRDAIDWSLAPTNIPRALAQPQGQSERILVKIPVDVSGVGANGEAFTERTFTLAIARNGAYISLRSSPRPGEPITITNIGTRQARAFRICDSDVDPASGVVAWGVESVEPAPNFWQIRFPESRRKLRTQENIEALIECGSCHSSEMTELTASQYHRLAENESVKRDCATCRRQSEWRFRYIDDSSEDKSSPTLETSRSKGGLTKGAGNRLDRRVLVRLPIIIRHRDGRTETTTTENVSSSGVSCATTIDLKVGDAVLLTFDSLTGVKEEEAPALIMWRRAMIVKGKILYGIKLDRTEAISSTQPGSREATSARQSGTSADFNTSRPEPASGAAAENANAQFTPRPGGVGIAPALSSEGVTDSTQAPSTPSSVIAQLRRESEGILLKIPVEVSGINLDGKAFTERTFTLAVARNGAYISLRSSPRPGEPVTITNIATHQSLPFRLRDSDLGLPGEMVAWGVECLKPAPDFWQIRFPEVESKPLTQNYIGALIECGSCHTSEMAELTPAQYQTFSEKESMTRDCQTCRQQTEWRFRFIDESTGDRFVPSLKSSRSKRKLTKGIENRVDPRVLVKLPMMIRHNSGRVETTITENVSTSGVCCAAYADLQIGEVVLLTFDSGTGAREEGIPSRVMWRRSMIVKKKILYGIRLELSQSPA